MGSVEAWHCAKEWQKRSFSHAHCIIYLGKDDKETKYHPDNIDQMISAEIQDPKKKTKTLKNYNAKYSAWTLQGIES